MEPNYFRPDSEFPYHLSVGAVVVRQDGKICCHHFTNKLGLDNLYLLMRETINPHETLENALLRGAREEFGQEVEIKNFLGSIVSRVQDANIQFEKTTLYFLCLLKKEIDRDLNDEEADSLIEWYTSQELAEKMRFQELPNRTDLNESEILKRVIIK